MAVVYVQAQVDTLLAAKAAASTVATLSSTVGSLSASSVGAVPQALASGATGGPYLGVVTTLPASAPSAGAFCIVAP